MILIGLALYTVVLTTRPDPMPLEWRRNTASALRATATVLVTEWERGGAPELRKTLRNAQRGGRVRLRLLDAQGERLGRGAEAQSAPQSERSAPQSERSAPQSERSAPQSERSAPQSERSAPQSERSAPQSERSAPQSERSAPQSERSAPQSERSAPQSERSAPQSERSAPQSERSAPQSERSAPQSERSAPQSERSAPQSERSAPQSERSARNSESRGLDDDDDGAGSLRARFRHMVERAATSGQPAFEMFGTRVAVAIRETSESGVNYILVADLPRPESGRAVANARTQLVGGAVALLLSGLVCWGLVRYLTAPLVGLRGATRQLAAGDLSARTGAGASRRHDEVADLGRDFDVMAARIENLIEGQRQLLGDISHELRSPLARLRMAGALGRRQIESDARGRRVRARLRAHRARDRPPRCTDRPVARFDAPGKRWARRTRKCGRESSDRGDRRRRAASRRAVATTNASRSRAPTTFCN